MTLIDLGEFKLRFDPKDVRISIDGDLIDIGAKSTEKDFNKYDFEYPYGEVVDLGDGTYMNIKTKTRYIKKKVTP